MKRIFNPSVLLLGGATWISFYFFCFHQLATVAAFVVVVPTTTTTTMMQSSTTSWKKNQLSSIVANSKMSRRRPHDAIKKASSSTSRRNLMRNNVFQSERFSIQRSTSTTAFSSSVMTKQKALPKLLHRLYASSGTDDDDVETSNNTKDMSDNFDAQGFGGYLAPYALALVASVVVTGAFIKFVLLDY